MWTKSQAALILTALRLFDSYPKSMYFWTITSVRVMCDWQYPIAWKRFSEILHNNMGFCVGVRVLEPHESHGLHYHMLINRRVGIELMRRWARAAGFGWKGQCPRVHVCKATVGAAYYIAKYISKGGVIHRGLHRWGMIGGYAPTRKNLLEIDSITMRAFRKVTDGMKWPYAECRALWAECELHAQIVLDRWQEICQDGAVKASERLASVRSVTHRYTQVRRVLAKLAEAGRNPIKTYEIQPARRSSSAQHEALNGRADGIRCADEFFTGRVDGHPSVGVYVG
jgi:hypothetical protein